MEVLKKKWSRKKVFALSARTELLYLSDNCSIHAILPRAHQLYEIPCMRVHRSTMNTTTESKIDSCEAQFYIALDYDQSIYDPDLGLISNTFEEKKTVG